MKPKSAKRPETIPRHLIPGRGKAYAPGMIKRHVARMCASIDDRWRLFAEGCLRNRYFREEALKNHPSCAACNRTFDETSRIEQHHNDYLWSCTGEILDEDSPDIHRKARAEEFPQVPDCRSCHLKNPDQFKACQKRIFPVHAACHERIHEKERYWRTKDREDLIEAFDARSGR